MYYYPVDIDMKPLVRKLVQSAHVTNIFRQSSSQTLFTTGCHLLLCLHVKLVVGLSSLLRLNDLMP